MRDAQARRRGACDPPVTPDLPTLRRSRSTALPLFIDLAAETPGPRPWPPSASSIKRLRRGALGVSMLCRGQGRGLCRGHAAEDEAVGDREAVEEDDADGGNLRQEGKGGSMVSVSAQEELDTLGNGPL